MSEKPKLKTLNNRSRQFKKHHKKETPSRSETPLIPIHSDKLYLSNESPISSEELNRVSIINSHIETVLSNSDIDINYYNKNHKLQEDFFNIVDRHYTTYNNYEQKLESNAVFFNLNSVEKRHQKAENMQRFYDIITQELRSIIEYYKLRDTLSMVSVENESRGYGKSYVFQDRYDKNSYDNFINHIPDIIKNISKSSNSKTAGRKKKQKKNKTKKPKK
jgi:hypothetical protein